MMKRYLLAAALWLASTSAWAVCPPQSTPVFNAPGNVFDRVASQWNSYFAAKADTINGTFDEIIAALGYTPVNKAGDTMSGTLNISNGTGTSFTTTGSVGIGTTNPQSSFQVTASNPLVVGYSRFTTSDYVDGSTGSGLIFNSGANTGNTWSSINAFSAGNTTSASLALGTNGGNVGIGTTSPASQLNMVSSVARDMLAIDMTPSGSGESHILLRTGAGLVMARLRTDSNGGSFNPMVQLGDTSLNFAGTGGLQDTGGLFLGPNSSSAKGMRIDGVTGNIGIGTSTPPAKLSVGGGLQTPQSGFGVNESDVWTSIYNSPTTNAGTIQVTSGGSASAIGSTGFALSLNPNGGNVGIGIGTGTPGALLSIANGANDPGTYGRAIQITNANGNRQQMAFIRNGNNVISAGYNGVSAVWGFGTGNTTDASFTPNFLAIDQANTRIGINTIAPNFTLDVVGDINTSSMYRVGGSQIAAANLSNGTTGSGAVALAVSPALTGSPTAPTQTAADSSTKIATTAFVHGITGGVSTVKITVFTASGTYTPTANLLYADVV